VKIRPFLLGLRDGFEQGELSSGLTWDDDQGANEAYDRGANWGERFARLKFWVGGAR
jgi:hypothetical protein